MTRLPYPNQASSPPFPQFIVLTDRADGTLWVLSHDVTGEYVAINDAGLAGYTDFIVYPAGSGPIVADTPSNPIAQKAAQKRLFVRGGRLGYEDVADEIEQGPVMTRRGRSRILRRIFVPDTWRMFQSGSGFRNDDVLGYRSEDLV